MSLFDDNGAQFSEFNRHRYALWRVWDKSKPKVLFIGLNPSTANSETDDPTIRRVKGFAHELGFGGVCMGNLFSLVSTDPRVLLTHPDALRDLNDDWLDLMSRRCTQTIFAWGSFPQAKERAAVITERFEGYALKINADGSPAHPLYLKKDLKPIPFKK